MAATPSFRVMGVAGVAVELPDQFPVVTLLEAEAPGRRLDFRVGMPEGAALAAALRGTSAPRPLTHELLCEVVRRLGADVVAVRLVGRQGATYLAELDLMTSRGREVFACRPSDGIVLALRQTVQSPVLADERLLATDGDVAAPG